MQSHRSVFAIALLSLATACHSPTSPAEGGGHQLSVEHGRLSGLVTIGPNCPGPQQNNNPCPTQPSAYAARKILIFNEAGSTLLFNVDIDSQGLYLIDLAPAKYTVVLRPSGSDHTPDLPKVVDITANGIMQLNVNIDTGIR